MDHDLRKKIFCVTAPLKGLTGGESDIKTHNQLLVNASTPEATQNKQKKHTKPEPLGATHYTAIRSDKFP